MSDQLWHGWVKGNRWQRRLLDGLGVMGAKRYNKEHTAIEHCIVDDIGLALLLKYWPRLRYAGGCIEGPFTLSDNNNNQVWGPEREARLEYIMSLVRGLPDVWPGSVSRHVKAWSDVNDFTMRRVQ